MAIDGFSNYPGGFAGGLTVRGMPVTMLHPGKVFWVGNATASQMSGHKSASNGNKGTFDAPWSTIVYAITQVVAGRGDIVMVKPGHSEAVTGAAGMVFSKSGMALVGLGTGALRPKISFTTAAGADIDITAGNQTFANINFQANFADVTAAIDISGVEGITFSNCYFTEGAANLNFVDVIDVATGAADFVFEKCTVRLGDAANDSWITGVDFVGLKIYDCDVQLNVAQTAAVGVIETSGNATFVDIKDSNFESFVDGALFLDFNGTANRGCVSNCNFSSNDGAGAVTAGFDFTGGHMFECYVAGEDDTYGIIGGGAAYNNS